MIDVLVIGGGLAGLFNAILLNRAGLKVVLIEKNQYPFHRVCGEYISNEVLPFLETHGLFPSQFNPPSIRELELSSVSGRVFTETLDLGGFGISRFAYDHWLSQVAISEGVMLHEKTNATDVFYTDNHFETTLQTGETLTSKYVIGAFGKRSKLDQKLNRLFLNKKSPYVGVKYHIHADLPHDRISLHNFQGGYAGISQVENSKFNLCYLVHRDAIRSHGSIPELEKHILSRNPLLKKVFSSAEFLMDKPEVINEITFDKQEPIYHHILMSGDSAGMITPLCGNGMAMAIRSAATLSQLLMEAHESGISRTILEQNYTRFWQKSFGQRLWFGRKIQSLFGDGRASNFGVILGKFAKPVTRYLIRQTHGEPFN